MSSPSIDVELLGRSIRVSCPDQNSAELYYAADVLNKRLEELKEKTGAYNIEQLIFITSLNICHELELEKQKSVHCIKHIKSRMLALNKMMDTALNKE
ncbi:Cell division protein ZapA [Buchnera aphidicola (Cinara kochiana kochiana)]|uniref:Cell division protein ZapA n=1 Tax=Buchnera aphidicola (Cinara kochiana kochiana) TaxID=2518976 RepID=A0A451D5Y3_9GAMM|nr:cell division protein ZapA [Buchnera aphidicola]VFP81175.1 Cell division protein ZapA [Buchnera aphidicola (Cinara kochiana kochiana)]